MNTVLITGASRGIGKETAEVFAKNGARLALVCKNSKEEMSAHADYLAETYGVPVRCYFGDIADYSFVESMKGLEILVFKEGFYKKAFPCI